MERGGGLIALPSPSDGDGGGGGAFQAGNLPCRWAILSATIRCTGARRRGRRHHDERNWQRGHRDDDAPAFERPVRSERRLRGQEPRRRVPPRWLAELAGARL